MKDGAGETLGLAQGQVEDLAQQQAGLDGGIGILERSAAASRRGGRKPLVNGGLINPEGKASARGKG